MIIEKCQEIFNNNYVYTDNDVILLSDKTELVDVSKTGKIRPWRRLKSHNIIMSEIYNLLGDCYAVEKEEKEYYYKKSDRLSWCGRELVFEEYLSLDTHQYYKKLKNANFCRVRCCPLCQWRRALKLRYQMRDILNEFNKTGSYRYYFLTLTIQNCSPSDLEDRLNLMFSSWDRLLHHKEIKRKLVGWSRTLEITLNTDRKSEFYHTFHPHFHCILAFENNCSRILNNKNFWVDHWRIACFGDDEMLGLQCINPAGQDIRPIYPKKSKNKNGDFFDSFVSSCLELIKYQTDYDDLLDIDVSDSLFTVNTIRLFDDVFNKRRLISFGGMFKKIRHDLLLDDVENGNLLNVDEDKNIDSDVLIRELRYIWWSGYNLYLEK